MSAAPSLTWLDGPMGTELEHDGHATPAPAWSAEVVLRAPEAVSAVHRRWVEAGARVHTTATFRTTERALAGHPLQADWRELTERAVRLCRDAIPADQRVAGSMAPLEDCYEPQRTPDRAALRREHTQLARALAEAGCDLLLVETIPSVDELRACVRAAAEVGLPVWAMITLGPRGDFFDTAQLAEAADIAQSEGAQLFGLNCCAPQLVRPALEHLATLSARPAQLGASANTLFGEASAADYVALARDWIAAGVDLIGTCCGTRPEHLRALVNALGDEARPAS